MKASLWPSVQSLVWTPSSLSVSLLTSIEFTDDVGSDGGRNKLGALTYLNRSDKGDVSFSLF